RSTSSPFGRVSSVLRILMCYNKTSFTPGRYLEDGLRRTGVDVDVSGPDVEFVDSAASNHYDAVLFVESPSRPPVRVLGIERVKSPKLLWVHHGANRLVQNLALCREYRPDLVLMAHSLELAPHFPA